MNLLLFHLSLYKYLSEDDNIIGLEIEDIDESDAGEYTCVATNEKGEDSFSCQLNVNDPPQNDETRSHQSSDDEEEVECEAFDEEENPSLNATQESSKDDEEAQCDILDESEEQNPLKNDETRSHQSSDDEEEVENETFDEEENPSLNATQESSKEDEESQCDILDESEEQKTKN